MVNFRSSLLRSNKAQSFLHLKHDFRLIIDADFRHCGFLHIIDKIIEAKRAEQQFSSFYVDFL